MCDVSLGRLQRIHEKRGWRKEEKVTAKIFVSGATLAHYDHTHAVGHH
jgi:hypothetical protein